MQRSINVAAKVFLRLLRRFMKFEGVPENEFAMMTLAGMIGMDVPDVELVELEVVSGLPKP